jgi:hypothetical protein
MTERRRREPRKMTWKHRWARFNAPFLAKSLRHLADQIDHLVPGTPVLAFPIVFSTGEGVFIMGEITVSTDDSSISASVTYLDSKGNSTQPADVPVWESSDPAVASVEASEDGMSATVSPLSSGDGSGGAAAIISVVAHDDDGEEVRSEGTVTVRPGDAVIGEVTFTPSGEEATTTA